MFPVAICMAFELAAYGVMAGLFYMWLPKKKGFIYASLLSAMIIGRLVWGISMLVCMGVKGGNFGISAFWAGAVVEALPGIAVQIVVIPVIVMVAERVMQYDKNW